MAVLAYVEDLFFRSKLETAARVLRVPLEVASGSPPAGGPWDTVLVDLALNRTDPMALAGELRRACPQARLIAYGAHVDRARLERARAAGYDRVLSHAELVARLPELLQGQG